MKRAMDTPATLPKGSSSRRLPGSELSRLAIYWVNLFGFRARL